MKMFKKILFVGLVIQFASGFAFADCDLHKKTMAVVDAIEKYEVKLGFIAEPGYTTLKTDIAELGQLCPNSDRFHNITVHLSAISFCISLANETLASAQNTNLLKTKNPANQKAFEKALLSFGQLFQSASESQSFTCELKNIHFPSL